MIIAFAFLYSLKMNPLIVMLVLLLWLGWIFWFDSGFRDILT